MTTIFFKAAVYSSGAWESKSKRKVEDAEIVLPTKVLKKINNMFASGKGGAADVFMERFFDPLVHNETASSVQGFEVYVSDTINGGNFQKSLRDETLPLAPTNKEFSIRSSETLLEKKAGTSLNSENYVAEGKNS